MVLFSDVMDVELEDVEDDVVVRFFGSEVGCEYLDVGGVLVGVGVAGVAVVVDVVLVLVGVVVIVIAIVVVSVH